MRILFNPVFARMIMVFLASFAAFAVGAFAIHRFRKDLNAEAESLSQSPLASEGLPIHSYHAVIQELKQQKHELAAQQLSDRRKSRASDALSAAVFTNISCGVLFFNTAGLLRQANPAARQLLGFASPVGMSVSDLFRSTTLAEDPDMPQSNATLLDLVAPALSGDTVVRDVVFDFVAPDGSQRSLDLTVSPVLGDDTRPIGTTFVLSDRSELERARKDGAAHQEIASEMALTLRTSLTTICGYAQQLAKCRDSHLAQQLATDISTEAAQLDRSVGSFLSGSGANAATASS